MKLIYILTVGLGIFASTPEAHGDPAVNPREHIEWVDYWSDNANKSDLPRVLLLGDSITKGYSDVVTQELAGKAYVTRFATSHFISDPMLLGEIALFLDNNKFDVIHFNNGMHGWQFSEEDYKAAFPAYLAIIQQHAPQAKLIWGTTTPASQPGKIEQLSSLTDRVKVRNSIAHAYISKEGITEDDLFALVLPHPEWHDSGGIHFLPPGKDAEGKQVAREVEKVLPVVTK